MDQPELLVTLPKGPPQNATTTQPQYILVSEELRHMSEDETEGLQVLE